MSAPTSNASPATTPSGTNGGPKIIRSRAPADPLVRPKQRPRRPPTNGAPSGAATALRRNGPTKAPTSSAPSPASQRTYDGWSKPPKAGYQDFPLITTKRALREGMRYHVMRLISAKPIDPRNEEEFTRPVRLQRKDPRVAGPGEGMDGDGDVRMGDGPDVKDPQRHEILRAEREAQRAANAAQIAPSAASADSQRKIFKKKTQQVFRNDATAEGQARSKLKYEEYYQWNLEDFDNKNTWAGNYEAALSNTNVCMTLRDDGKFVLIPLEKWYKFTSKTSFKTLSIEEAEKSMSRKVKEPRWFMDSQKESERRQEEDANRRAWKPLNLRKTDGRDAQTNQRLKADLADADDLDFDEDRFADDEENPVFEGDEEESKVAEERIKRDQLKANIFDLKDVNEYDKEDAEERKKREMEKQLGKGVVKALKKLEGKYEYDSDDDNPYSSASDSSDLFEDKEEDKKKEEEKNEKKDEKPKEGEKPKPSVSGHKKHSDLLKLNRKRPGSPDHSDLSGNESTRKRTKHKGGMVSGSSTPRDGPHPTSPGPALPHRKSSIITLNVKPSKLNEISSIPPKPAKRRPQGAGSGSDGEGSDGSTVKRSRITLRVGGQQTSTSPNGSRASSPANDPRRDRQGSPKTGAAAAAAPRKPGTRIPESEIRAAVPTEGISIKDLAAKFKHRNPDIGALVASVKKFATIGPNKIIRPMSDK